MKKFILPLLFIGVALMTSCEKDADESPELKPVEKTLFTGCVEKGPYAMGATVTIFELDDEMSQTGKTFVTTISDNKGSFEQRNMLLATQYVELRANGYYFDEVKGELTTAPLTLSAIADVKDVDNVNINILTTIERPRIYELMLREGLSFTEAREKAHNEALANFGMADKSIEASESLSLNNDAQLLAISAIVQSNRSVSEVSLLISGLANDLREDGVVEDVAVTSLLMNGFHAIKAQNLIDNLGQLQIEANYVAEEVDMWLDVFVQNTDYQQSEYIKYPTKSLNMLNILAVEDNATLNVGEYSFAAQTPLWANLRVEVKANKEFYYANTPAPRNWDIAKAQFLQGDANASYYVYQTFDVMETGVESTLKMCIFDNCTMKLTFYEYDSETPTLVKTVNFKK